MLLLALVTGRFARHDFDLGGPIEHCPFGSIGRGSAWLRNGASRAMDATARIERRLNELRIRKNRDDSSGN